MEIKESLEQFVTHLQTINRHLRSKVLDRQDSPLTRVQWLLLRHLHREGTSTIGQLASHLDVRSSTMSQMIDRLEKARLVYRESSQPDARVRMVALTDEGTNIILQSKAVWAETLSDAFEQFNEVERQQFLDYIQRLSDSVQKKA
ncbi:MarR family winged helix-turn-helix transcriptional regulator [Paenibacillus cremeus]|uniref:MarR family transcriptional regulator n=1 Tax=Paenibacillus cremeus TaxID=2163881 RepID=A0A559KD98_9BACL|nr:MarR family transcriptional regulator [Paenibacillus cremeus]TVY10085.1 MarR family transcriptional regulator [Paenibacillus cremeus]